VEAFVSRDKELWCEEVPLGRIAAAAGVPAFLRPGRSLVAHSGILHSKVLYIKRNERKFVIVDGDRFEIFNRRESPEDFA
jgi:hypothetical protein